MFSQSQLKARQRLTVPTQALTLRYMAGEFFPPHTAPEPWSELSDHVMRGLGAVPQSGFPHFDAVL